MSARRRQDGRPLGHDGPVVIWDGRCRMEIHGQEVAIPIRVTECCGRVTVVLPTGVRGEPLREAGSELGYAVTVAEKPV